MVIATDTFLGDQNGPAALDIIDTELGAGSIHGYYRGQP